MDFTSPDPSNTLTIHITINVDTFHNSMNFHANTRHLILTANDPGSELDSETGRRGVERKIGGNDAPTTFRSLFTEVSRVKGTNDREPILTDENEEGWRLEEVFALGKPVSKDQGRGELAMIPKGRRMLEIKELWGDTSTVH